MWGGCNWVLLGTWKELKFPAMDWCFETEVTSRLLAQTPVRLIPGEGDLCRRCRCWWFPTCCCSRRATSDKWSVGSIRGEGPLLSLVGTTGIEFGE